MPFYNTFQHSYSRNRGGLPQPGFPAISLAQLSQTSHGHQPGSLLSLPLRPLPISQEGVSYLWSGPRSWPAAPGGNAGCRNRELSPASDATGTGGWTPARIWIPQFDLLQQVVVLHVFLMPGVTPG